MKQFSSVALSEEAREIKARLPRMLLDFKAFNVLKRKVLSVFAHQLPDDVITHRSRLFLELDQDADGTLSFQELNAVFPNDTEEYVRDVFVALDLDGSGT